ncbi:DUF4397 domain-containing protein [Natronorubrum tibetense]|uniref:DUF4397 domain-containing protein n=1 Tax=Natronorubrum tibetense TaxID=63128 RepID=UPI000484F86C|nr:DUF4397 domain-containing protein [Natronorubrum tibetense]
MRVSRRTALKSIGIAGGLAAVPTTVYARGEHSDDERKPMNDEPEEKPPAPGAAVRVAHFSPDAPAVDVLVDGDQVLSNFDYGEVSPYLEIEPGTYQVTITAAGDPGTVVFDDQVDVGEAFYTVAAIGELGAETFRPEILVDAEPLPEDAEAGSAFVRVAHFSPDAPAVDIYADDAPLVENVSFGDVSDYLAVPAGEYTLSIRPAGDPETEVASFDVALEADRPYTGYAIGYFEPPADVTDRDFTVEPAIDGPMAAEEDEHSAGEDDYAMDDKEKPAADEKAKSTAD